MQPQEVNLHAIKPNANIITTTNNFFINLPNPPRQHPQPHIGTATTAAGAATGADLDGAFLTGFFAIFLGIISSFWFAHSLYLKIEF
jgi:hypothetical protein